MTSTLNDLRTQITQVSEDISELLGMRHALSIAIGKEKQRLDIPIRDPGREAILLHGLVNWNTSGVPPELIEDVFEIIFKYSVEAQTDNL